MDKCHSPQSQDKENRRNVLLRFSLKIGNALYDWNQRRLAMHTLQRLTETQLRDIGMSRSDIKRDYNRPFWK
ncbi:hypothetical protein B4914_02760 [Yersinia entomophaga]|nr:hypothetical protein B4914_02760 [Yersinia entomophaga]